MSKRLTLIALFAAMLAALSMLIIPMPAGVPVTLQTFAAALCGYCLGAKRGVAAVAVYLAIGACGVPVFAGFGGGLGHLLGLSGGFLWGFLLLASACGLARGGFWKRFAIGLAGLCGCCLAGVLQYAYVANTSILQGFWVVCLPYLWKDVACVAGAAALSARLSVKKINIF